MKVNAKTEREGQIIEYKQKELEQVNDLLATDGISIYYNVNGVWYDLMTNVSSISWLVKMLDKDADFIKNTLIDKITNVRRLCALHVELCNAIGISGADESQRNYTEKMARKAMEDEKRRQEIIIAREKERINKIRQVSIDFSQGRHISAEDFTLLCSYYGVEMHPRTVGYIRSNVLEISTSSNRLYDRRKHSNLLGQYIRELYNSIPKDINL